MADLARTLLKIGAAAFGGCINLTSVTLPQGLQDVHSGAFNGCSSLTSVTLPHALKPLADADSDLCKCQFTLV